MISNATIAARNLANARHSTGPQSDEGKARSSRNAIRHGATAAAAQGDVLRWAAIILEQPELPPEKIDSSDPSLQRVLDLAEAEARHAQALTALRAFEAGKAPPTQALLDDLVILPTYEMLLQAGLGDFVASMLESCRARIQDETQPNGKRHRLLKRYLREARAKRDAAFRAWLAEDENSGEA
jgi:hypothetical protein